MTPTLRALLTGLIDYAGLFPPAKLSLDQAIRNYAAYRQCPERWMLGKFVIPATRLQELAAFDKLFQDNPPFCFSALGRGGKNADEFLQGLAGDLAAIAAFCDRHSNNVRVDVLELKLPEEITRPANQPLLKSTLVRAVDAIEAAGPPNFLRPYFEAALTADWQTSMKTTHAALEYLGRLSGPPLKRYRVAGFKLRCGGLEASAIPSPEQVAAVIFSCRDHGISFKATAGLHHPFRRFDAGLQTLMHGFMNVFCAAAFALSIDAQDDAVLKVIEDKEPRRVVFDDTHIHWGNQKVRIDDVESSRLILATSFGSCSFDEPRDDLRALGLLP
jgi:hypothetical protein